jgi:hypothetical protein
LSSDSLYGFLSVIINKVGKSTNVGCQNVAKLLIALLIGMFTHSCSKSEVQVTQYDIPKINKRTKWFKGNNQFSLTDKHGNFPLHPFFDYAPNADLQRGTINFFITTPENSEYSYGFDLVSGRSYRRNKYCAQEDIWKKYDSELERPNFSNGIVPRSLDQLGKPQRIIVFGKSGYFFPYSSNEPKLESVRVVGGVVEQFCKNFPCTTRDKWLSRLVLVAVKVEDPRFAKVRTLASLKKIVDWGYTKAFLENGQGRTFEGDKQLPAYRIVGSSGPKNALNFSIDNGYIFSEQAIESMKNSCHKLYRFIWQHQKDIREFNRQKDLRGKDKGPKINKYLGTFRESEFRDDPKSGSNEVRGIKRSFAVFMNIFYEKYSGRYKTCQKYVRASNLTRNTERHWFFALFEAFSKLEDIGFIYKCNRKAWIENPLLSNGKFMYSPKKERKRCTNAELDRAFDMAVTIFSGLQRSNSEHYYYVQYDQGKGGSHQRLYSWIHHNGKRLGCFNSGEKEYRARDKLVFPRDINWSPFSTDKRKGIFDIIR